MDPIWLDSYPAGVPKTLTVNPDETLVDLLEATFVEWAPRPAFHNLGRTLSFAELDRLTRQFAVYLRNDLGLQPGDRVALMLPNLLQYPVALFGCLRAALVVVNVNPLYTARELEHQLVDSGARALVVYAGSAHVFAEIRHATAVEHVLVTLPGDLLPPVRRMLVNFVVRYLRRLVPAYSIATAEPFTRFLDADPAAYTRPAGQKGKDLAILQYTGGTTGLAKGAMLSHSNLIANIRQISCWFAGNHSPGHEIIITALPLYHVYALTVNCFSYFVQGALNVLITDPRDTAAFVKELGRWPFTAMTGVNTLFQSLVRNPGFAKLDFSALKIVSAGGMATQEATAKEWARITGDHIIEGYGLSETSPVVSSNPLDLAEFNGSIGLPLPGTEIAIRDEQGREVPVGEPGELFVRGPQVMLGYWNQPGETAKVLGADGFLETGDVVTINARGYLKIVDRKKDMIIVSGLKVYPNEVEQTVTQHPDVLEAACIGASDPESGEMVKLFVVLRPGATLTPQSLRAWCKQNMSAYKVPRQIEFRQSLPKSNVGKILRRELRSE